jgi:hypothetical protein
MSNEGVRFVSRAALVVLLILVTAVFRTVMGPGRRRGRYILAGTLAGISLGVGVGSLINRWFGIDVSVICACVGIWAGWTVAWVLAREIPREAH